MKKRAVWRIMALALTLVMILSLAVTAMAAVAPAPEETDTPNGAVPIREDPDNPGQHIPPYEVDIYPNDYVELGDGTGGLKDTRFKAYQIFSGDVMYESDAGRIPDDTTGFGWIGEGQLAGLGWGVSIKNVENLLMALMEDITSLSSLNITPEDPGKYAKCETLGQLFQTALYDAKYIVKVDNEPFDPDNLKSSGKAYIAAGDSGDDINFSKAASVVASVLADFTPEGTNNAALAQAFARIVARKSNDNYDFLKQPEAESTWDNDHWVIGQSEPKGADYVEGIDHLAGGYYLIVDAGDGVTSDVMVGVFGDVDVYVKADLPRSDKNILNPDNNGRDNSKGADFELGDTIEFEITGTLRGNYADFKSYYFAFHDTLSDGLTYTGNANPQTDDAYLHAYVTIKNPLYKTQEEKPDRADYEKVEYIKLDITGLKGTPIFDDDNKYPGTAPLDETKFYVEYLEKEKPNLNIYFPDLKQLDIDNAALITNLRAQIMEYLGLENDQDGNAAIIDQFIVGMEITAQSVISVEYTAYLNENAKIGDLQGNPNEVYIEYSNDPTSDDKETSDTETVYTYDFGLQITKVDEKNPLKALPGAGFALVQEPQYPYFTNSTDTTPAGWIGESELLAYLGEENAENLQDYLDGTVLPAGTGAPNLEGKYLKGGTGAPTPTERYYAILKEVTVRNSVPLDPHEYLIAGWLPEGQLAAVLGSAEPDKDEWKAAVTGDKLAAYLSQGFGATAGDTYYIAVETDKDGVLRIVGMEDGTYYLREVYAPTGYQPLDGDISVRYEATYYTQADIDGSLELQASNTKAGMLKTLTVYVQKPGEGEKEYKIVEDGNWADGVDHELVVHFDVENTSSVWVPGTGGMGTTLLYIGGGVLLAGAAALLLVTNRKKSTGGKRAK